MVIGLTSTSPFVCNEIKECQLFWTAGVFFRDLNLDAREELFESPRRAFFESSAIMMVVLGGQGQGQGRQARFQLMPTSRINLKTFFGGVVVWGFCGGVDYYYWGDYRENYPGGK